MLKPNLYYKDLKDSYLFYNISQKVKAYQESHPGSYLYRMGIGDVSLPLCPAVIQGLRQGVEDQSAKKSFHGYMPECGADFLREAIAGYYKNRGVELSPDEVFVSSGASDELGDILDLFDRENAALVIEPAYPAYVDANTMAGRKIIHLPAGKENGFLPLPDDSLEADIIYLCSPNNPTGAVYNRQQLQAWVDFANRRGAVILFDAAYEAFIEDPQLPHSIFEIEGARTCAIEICSLSKTAGFTGTRLGYTILPGDLNRDGMNLREMWVRNRTTKTNGISYLLQRGGAAVYNVGGIVGRQSNYVDGCENTGMIQGRKDVGGIAGQMEPQVTLRYNKDLLDQLWVELDNLQGLTNQAASDAQTGSRNISGSMNQLIANIDQAKNAVNGMSSAITNWGNENIQEVNDISARISWVIRELEPIAAELPSAAEQLENASSLLVQAAQAAENLGEQGKPAAAELQLASEDLSNAASCISNCESHLRAALEAAKGFINGEDITVTIYPGRTAANQGKYPGI